MDKVEMGTAVTVRSGSEWYRGWLLCSDPESGSVILLSRLEDSGKVGGLRVVMGWAIDEWRLRGEENQLSKSLLDEIGMNSFDPSRGNFLFTKNSGFEEGEAPGGHDDQGTETRGGEPRGPISTSDLRENFRDRDDLERALGLVDLFQRVRESIVTPTRSPVLIQFHPYLCLPPQMQMKISSEIWVENGYPVLRIMGRATLRPPYHWENCSSTNPAILSRLIPMVKEFQSKHPSRSSEIFSQNSSSQERCEEML